MEIESKNNEPGFFSKEGLKHLAAPLLLIAAASALFLTATTAFIEFRETEQVRNQVQIEISQEYGLNLDGVWHLECIAGEWHYKTNYFTTFKFNPSVSCADERGIDARISEKL